MKSRPLVDLHVRRILVTIRLEHVPLAAALTYLVALSAISAPADAARTRHAVAARQTASAAAPYVPQFETRVFARGTSTLYNPDGIVVTKHFVFVVYQNDSDTNPTPTTIVKYDRAGKLLGSLNLLGRCDGMRLNPVTHQLWALLNNDGLNGTPPRQPLLYTIDPRTLAAQLYRFGPTQPHGGGYDDIAFIGDHAFFSASSPTLNAAGVDDKPVVVEAQLTSGGTVTIKPILVGNAIGYDATAGTTARLHLNDPDSLAVDSKNDLVLVSEGDQQIALIGDPGGPKQHVERFGLGTGIDDIAWTRGTRGTLYIADDVVNAIYAVEARFAYGTVFAEATAGTPVSSFIGTVDGTGALTPLLTERDGIFDPTALIFVRRGDEEGDN